jgi:hypothetical protein
MTIKTGTYTGQTETPQTNNTVDITVNLSYTDNTSESNKKVAEDTMRITRSRAKPITVPLNSTTPILASAPDTEFATGNIRVRVTRFT